MMENTKIYIYVRHNIFMKIEVPHTLPNADFRKLVKLSRDKDFKKQIYENQEQRKIDWPEYNKSQINQVKETLKFIRDIVNSSYSPAVRSNATNPKDLAKTILLSEFLGFAERESEGWVEILGLLLESMIKLMTGF